MVYITVYLFLHNFFKNFRNTKFSLFKGSFFLKTGVIFASSKLSGKLPVARHLLKNFCKVSGEVLHLTFDILGWIVVAFLKSNF